MELVEQDALLALMLTKGLGHGLIGRCVAQFGSAASTFEASASALAQIKGISSDAARRIRRDLEQIETSGALEKEKALIEAHGVRLIALDDDDYPKLLRHIPDPPLLLWVRGELEERDGLGLAVVGARRCTHYGREQAERLAGQCAAAGLTIVSGGAYGIDAAAHRGALRNGGRTIAVVGSGLAEPYPADHAELYDVIAEPGAGSGAVVSEFPMGAPPIAENFPRRNRIISGLSLGTLVVEAAARSGALITARLCVEEHGRECMAVPGRVDSLASAGCHKIIREGWATLVTNAADILDALGEAGQLLKTAVTTTPGNEPSPSLFEQTLTDTQRRIVDAVAEPRSLDQIVAWSGLAVSQVQSDLTMLEIRGVLRRSHGLFVRRSSNG